MFHRRTAAEIESQKKELFDRAEKGLDALAEALVSDQTTAALGSWLRFVSRFHRYSLRNQLLIHLQRPDASLCAGFQAWKALGRSVKKGEHGIAILAPAGTGKKVERTENAQTGESEEHVVATWRWFRVVHIFDRDQTDGEALPENPSLNPHEIGPADLAKVEQAIATLCPVIEEPPGRALGWTDGKTIHVAAGQSSGSRIQTLFHEAAHYVLHFGEGAPARSTKLTKMRELEAEATACAVTTAMGFPFTGFSAAYLAS